MIRLQLSERPSVWIMDEIHSVGSRSCIAQNLITLVIFKNKMNILFCRVSTFTIFTLWCLQKLMVFVTVLEALQCKFTSNWCYEYFATLLLGS